ncbi:uncharacterized protein PSANT_03646 [Moesziomyces antarcticus]|uniref:Uncharacterized protein n=1 Tax=Pseudozyma antarctica TaxID=84753 RepID=A0A5C3FP49_PSEA2|nr:uncharacterized protein PSANT_03646 [Moesziomyces antarcticus]
MARDARLGPFVAPALAPLQRITSRDDARDTGQIRGPSSTPTSAASGRSCAQQRRRPCGDSACPPQEIRTTCSQASFVLAASSVSRRRFEPQPKPRGSMATEEEASSKRQLAKYRSRLRLHLFVSAPQIVGRRLASLASAHASLEKALRLAGQTSVFSASAPNSPVVSHVADVWSLAELRS